MTNAYECRANEPRYCWKHGISIKPSQYLPNQADELAMRDGLTGQIMTSPFVKVRVAAEEKLAAVNARLDASGEGYEALGHQLRDYTRVGDQLGAAHTQQRIEKADALRAELLADEAIDSYNPDNPNRLARLFDGTGYVAEHVDDGTENGHVLVRFAGQRNKDTIVREAEGATWPTNLLAYRRELANEQKYVEKYSANRATQDLPPGYSARVESGVDYEQLYVRDADGNALVLITLNPDHTFNSAKINSPYNDGSIASVPSLLALRATLFNLDVRNNGRLPAWVSGDSEPAREPVAASPASANGDQLF